jgi:tetratricopeptide (TPR) repeat protein
MEWLGYLYYRQQKNDSAMIMFESAVKAGSKSALCRKYTADILMSEGRFKEAAAFYSDALVHGAQSDTNGILLGRAFLLAGDREGARAAFTKVLEANPANAQARCRVVKILLQDGKKGEAERIFEQAGQSIRSGWLLLARAELLEADNRLEQAFNSYKEASALLPQEGLPYSGMGRISSKNRDYAKAIEYLGYAMGLDPSNTENLVDMGKAYAATGEDESAIAVYEEALKINPDNSEIYCLMADMFLKECEYSRCIKIAQRGLVIAPANAKLDFITGEAYKEMGRTLDAIKAYESAGKKGGNSMMEAYRHAGVLYYVKLVDRDNAEKALKKYVRAGGKNAEVDEILKKISED